MRPLARLVAKIAECTWIAPLVKREVLALNWDAVADSGIETYTASLDAWSQEVDRCCAQFESFHVLIEKYAVPGVLEAEVSARESGDLVEQIVSTLTFPVDNSVRSIYLSMTLAALTGARAAAGADPGHADSWWAELTSRIVGAPTHGDRLAEFAECLELETIDTTVRPDRLADAVSRRVTASNPIVRTEFYYMLVWSLMEMELFEHVIAVVDEYFCCRFGSDQPNGIKIGVGAMMDRLKEELVPAPGWETLAQGLFANLLYQFVALLRNSARASAQILARTGAGPTRELRRRQQELFDSVVGWEAKQPLNIANIDFLSRIAHAKDIGDLLQRWLRIADQADALDEVRGAFMVERRSWEDANVTEDTWWHLPMYHGRTALLLSVVAHLEKHRSGDSALAFVKDGMCPHGDIEYEVAGCLTRAPDQKAKELALALTACIAGILFRGNQDALVIRFLEGALQINRTRGYGCDEVRELCDATCFPGGECNSDAVECYAVLLVSLLREGHHGAAAALADAVFGLESEGQGRFARFNMVCDVVPRLRTLLVDSTLEALLASGEYQRALEAATQAYSMPDLATASNEELSAIPRQIAAKCNVSVPGATLCLVNPAIALGALHGSIVAIRFLECVLGVAECPDEELRDRLSTVAGEYIYVIAYLADSLLEARRPQRVLALVESISEKHPDGSIDWFSFRRRWNVVAGGMARWFDRVVSPMLGAVMLRALRTLGRSTEAWSAIERALPDSDWLDDETGCFGGNGAISLALECMALALPDHREYAWSLYLDVARSLEANALKHGVRDAIRLASSNSTFRQTLISIGASLSEMSGESEGYSDFRRGRILASDCQMAQRELLERFRQGRRQLQLQDGPVPVVGRAPGRSRGESVAALDQIPADAGQHAPHIVHRAAVCCEPGAVTTKFVPWYEMERTLVETLGGRPLLRAGFSLEGRLVWTLFRSDGRRLRVEIHEAGQFVDGARRRVCAAIERFDSQVDAIWDIHESGGVGRTRLVSALRASDGFRPLRDIGRHLADPLQYFPRTKRRMERQFGLPDLWFDGGKCPPSKAEWEAWWSSILPLFPQQPSDDIELSCQLHTATETFLDELDGIWPIDALAAKLRPDDDLLVWLDDVLLGIPIAFLAVRDSKGGRRFLFEHAESIRNIVSPVLEQWMRQLDVPCMSDPPVQIVSLSWFERNLPAEADAEEELQRLCAELQGQYGTTFEWRTAARNSTAPGHHDVLARGLQKAGGTGVALLIVCGHGSDAPRGVTLGDGVWSGSEVWERVPNSKNSWNVRGACDLSPVDFMIQLSCSIGRLEQSELQDVRGFCTELFLHRARSVFAGRWTLHAVESLELARLVSSEYLKLHADATEKKISLGEARARSRAVGAARAEWAKRFRTGDRTLGLYTMAGMDLFGLG